MDKRQFGVLLGVLAICFVALLVFFVYESRGIATEETPETGRYEMQVVLKARRNPPDFWRIVEMGIDVASAEFGVNCHVSGPESEIDVDGQIALVREAIAQKPDALILAAGDYERLSAVCEEAAEQGILLVMLDSDVESDKPKTLVATDNYELGERLAGLVNDLTEPGERFGVVGHVQNVTTAMQRQQGLLDNVIHSGERLAGLVYCDGSTDLARRQTVEMLQQNPDITCMVGLNESSALGVAYGVQEMNLVETVSVVVCDSSQEQIQFMENGTVQAAVVQNPFNMGYLSVEAAVDLLDGRRVDEYINTGSVVVTKDDLYKKENQKLLFPFTDPDE